MRESSTWVTGHCWHSMCLPLSVYFSKDQHTAFVQHLSSYSSMTHIEGRDFYGKGACWSGEMTLSRKGWREKQVKTTQKFQSQQKRLVGSGKCFRSLWKGYINSSSSCQLQSVSLPSAPNQPSQQSDLQLQSITASYWSREGKKWTEWETLCRFFLCKSVCECIHSHSVTHVSSREKVFIQSLVLQVVSHFSFSWLIKLSNIMVM